MPRPRACAPSEKHTHPPYKRGAGALPEDSARTELRHLVATLKEAVAYCRRLEGCMPALRALLASPHGDVVTDVIILLSHCRWEGGGRAPGCVSCRAAARGWRCMREAAQTRPTRARLTKKHRRQFAVPGAARALRGMWPLVFAREEGVRAAVLDAWYDLYLGDRDPKAQVRP